MHLCQTCRKHLPTIQSTPSGESTATTVTEDSSTTADNNNNNNNNNDCCFVCLGLWSHAESFRATVKTALEAALEPYCCQDTGINRFDWTKSPPVLSLPCDLLYRFQSASNFINANTNTTTTDAQRQSSTANFAQVLKEHAKAVMRECLESIEKKRGFATNTSLMIQNTNDNSNIIIDNNSHGALGVHVIVLPTSNVARPGIPKPSAKKRRYRHLDQESQGGDPRVNLERRLEQQGYELWPITQQNLTTPLETINQLPLVLFSATNQQGLSLECHATVWRRPFYLKSEYTKTRRDVSQTPFFVVDNGERIKKGASSIEEQIVPVIAKYCGGISNQNQDPTVGSKVVFGMCKFHASGREDMDVRMLLPGSVHQPLIKSPNDKNQNDSASSSSSITGRPFVCEIVDALCMPSTNVFPQIVAEINHTTTTNEHTCTTVNSPNDRSYGCNPLGVGIAPNLKYVPSTAFKTLQSDTEDKVKYYGCLCWSETPITDPSTTPFDTAVFPLEIQQQTPVRVLHRRANAIRTRHVLSCHLLLDCPEHDKDPHFFRLHLGTTAGTYVKEFVHGDLGRTIPSVSSLLACPTDILELDCEGIAL